MSRTCNLVELKPHHKKMAEMRVLHDYSDEQLLEEFSNHYSHVWSIKNVMCDAMMKEHMSFLVEKEFEKASDKAEKAKKSIYEELEKSIKEIIALRDTGNSESIRLKAALSLCAMAGMNVKGMTKSDTDEDTKDLRVIESNAPKKAEKKAS